MYNRVGLPSAKGSGTSGYIQRNLASAKPQKSRLQFLKDLRKIGRNPLPAQLSPSPAIISHKQRRAIYNFVEEVRAEMERSGRELSEVEPELKTMEKRLLEKYEHGELLIDVEADAHATATSRIEEAERFRSALGLSDKMRPGEPFDFDGQERKRLEHRLEKELRELKRLEAEEGKQEEKSVESRGRSCSESSLSWKLRGSDKNIPGREREDLSLLNVSSPTKKSAGSEKAPATKKALTQAVSGFPFLDGNEDSSSLSSSSSSHLEKRETRRNVNPLPCRDKNSGSRSSRNPRKRRHDHCSRSRF